MRPTMRTTSTSISTRRAGSRRSHSLRNVGDSASLRPLRMVRRSQHRCPRRFPDPTGDACPIADPHFAKDGCTTTIAMDAGARIRQQLDRESDTYKALYAKRTMVERINSQAEALGILRPKLRRGRAIVNQNTLTYVLINLRALARLRTAIVVTPAAAEPVARAA